MTARITLALLFVIPAALAYPWRTAADRWVLGVAVAAVIVLFAWWRGLFVTDIVRRRIAIVSRNRRGGHTRRATPDLATVTLRVDGAASSELPLPLLAGYVDRYGVRAHKVRVVSRDAAGERTTWIALTVAAKDNLAALQARSTRLPLRETTEIAARRLTDHLREVGWTVTPVDDAESPVRARRGRRGADCAVRTAMSRRTGWPSTSGWPTPSTPSRHIRRPRRGRPSTSSAAPAVEGDRGMHAAHRRQAGRPCPADRSDPAAR